MSFTGISLSIAKRTGKSLRWTFTASFCTSGFPPQVFWTHRCKESLIEHKCIWFSWCTAPTSALSLSLSPSGLIFKPCPAFTESFKGLGNHLHWRWVEAEAVFVGFRSDGENMPRKRAAGQEVLITNNQHLHIVKQNRATENMVRTAGCDKQLCRFLNFNLLIISFNESYTSSLF